MCFAIAVGERRYANFLATVDLIDDENGIKQLDREIRKLKMMYVAAE